MKWIKFDDDYLISCLELKHIIREKEYSDVINFYFNLKDGSSIKIEFDSTKFERHFFTCLTGFLISEDKLFNISFDAYKCNINFGLSKICIK